MFLFIADHIKFGPFISFLANFALLSICSVTKYQKNTRRPIVTKKEVGREREVVVVKNKIVKPSVNIMKVVQKQGWPLRRSTSYLLVFMLSDFERDYLLKVQLICPKCKNKRTSEISSWSSVEPVEFWVSIRSIVFQNNSFQAIRF